MKSNRRSFLSILGGLCILPWHDASDSVAVDSIRCRLCDEPGHEANVNIFAGTMTAWCKNRPIRDDVLHSLRKRAGAEEYLI